MRKTGETGYTFVDNVQSHHFDRKITIQHDPSDENFIRHFQDRGPGSGRALSELKILTT